MLKQVIPPKHLPVSLEEVKVHLRLDTQAEDDYLERLVQAATNVVESYLGRSLIKQTWCLTQPVDEPGNLLIRLPNPPLIGIVEVKAIYSDVSQKVLTRFSIKGKSLLPHLSVFVDGKGIEVTYEAGYGETPKEIPGAIKQAILMASAELYLNRETGKLESNNLWQTLLQPFKVWRVL